MSDTYISVIEFEKELSREFLRSLNIYGSRFYENEYSQIAPILKNTEFVYKLLEIIDNLMCKKKIAKRYRYLILVDSLMSMTSFGFRNPHNYIFTFNRDEYLFKIQQRAVINSIFDIDYCEYLSIHREFLVGMRSESIVSKKIVRSENNGE